MEKPTDFPVACAGCWWVWVTAESGRYARTEFRIMKLAILAILLISSAFSQTEWTYVHTGGQWKVLRVGSGLRVNPITNAFEVAAPLDLSLIPISRLCVGTRTVETVLRGNGTCGPVPAHQHAAEEITSGIIAADRLPVGYPIRLRSGQSGLFSVKCQAEADCVADAVADLIPNKYGVNNFTNLNTFQQLKVPVVPELKAIDCDDVVEVGKIVYLSTAPKGKRLYACDPDGWTVQGN